MRAIVTTTINPPTEAILKFAAKKDWKLYIVGDLKTPSDEFKDVNATYLTPEYQIQKYPELSRMIGWNKIQRRNIGLVEAYRDGAEIVATVDDDNIPYDHWGEDLLIGKKIEIDCYENEREIFDPLSVTNHAYMWHRGYPIQLLNTRLNNKFIGKICIEPKIQADLWDGEPDVDAICRLTNNHPFIKITGDFPYTSKGITVFNSQNTFIHRDLLPYYCVVLADRMDDIWGGILLQKQFPTEHVVFQKPSVFQRRNPHNIVNDLERELMGHYETMNIINGSNKNQDEFCSQFTQNCLM